MQEILLHEYDPRLLDMNTTVMVSDSSESKTFIYEAETLKTVEEYPFSLDEQEQSSTHRELLAIVKLFEQRQDFLKQHEHSVLVWATDSQILVIILKRGSRIKKLQDMLLFIKEQESLFNIRLIPVWQRRNTNLMMIADDGSKTDHTNEYGISSENYDYVCDFMNIRPMIDGMATCDNTKCKRFFSKLPSPGCAGVNFLYQDLTDSPALYLHPPVELIIPVLNKIREYAGLVVILVVPEWISQMFWTSLVDVTGFKSFIKKHLRFNADFKTTSDRCIFRGHMQFNTYALLIET